MTQAPATPKLEAAAAGDAEALPPLGSLAAAAGGASSCARTARGAAATVRAKAKPAAARVRERTGGVVKAMVSSKVLGSGGPPPSHKTDKFAAIGSGPREGRAASPWGSDPPAVPAWR